MTYSIDTSCFLESWNHLYPIDTFPSLWKRFAASLAAGTVSVQTLVAAEIRHQADALTEWFDSHCGSAVIDFDEEVQRIARGVLAKYPKLVAMRKRKTSADPFVIALAIQHNLTVITLENPGTDGRPGIPLVCNAYGIRSINLLDFFRENSWSF